MGFLGNFNGIMMTDENEKPMSSIKEIWAGIGYVPQKNNSAFSFLVKEAILMGRNPKMGEFSMPSEKDTKIVQDIMDKMNLSDLQDKETSKLSGENCNWYLLPVHLQVNQNLCFLMNRNPTWT